MMASATLGTSADRGLAAPLEDALEDSLRDIGIPPRPAILDRIGAEMRKPEPDFRHLATLISVDVALAAGLLKTANSPYFGFQTRAKTVMQALMMLGLEVTGRAVAGLVLRRVFPPSPAMERFWDGSARIARTSGWLVGQLGARDNVRADEAYTYGLFRDCGIPILMKKFPDYANVLRAANADAGHPFTAVEQAHCPTTHALVGCLMVQNWWLPDEFSTAIRHHHDPLALRSGCSGISATSARLVALAQLAEYLVQRITRQSATREWDKLGGACMELLGLDGNGVELLAREAPAVVADVID
jgi:HD-like signal output (HDOD) protein